MDVGYLWTHLPDPPWASVTRTPMQSQLQPFTPLAPPSWAAMSAAYIRDMETLEERLGSQGNRQRPKPDRKPKPGEETKNKDGKNKHKAEPKA